MITGRVLRALAIIVPAAILGKVCQSLAVAHLAPRIGFDAASLVGLAPVLLALVLLKSRFPRLTKC